MVGKTLVQALVIGLLSTGLYVVFTKDAANYGDSPRRSDRTQECLCIACIVTTVACVLLLMTGASEQIVMKESISTQLNHKAPF
jgi:hypothetical protein